VSAFGVKRQIVKDVLGQAMDYLDAGTGEAINKYATEKAADLGAL
jgi:hypothetical protein